MHSNNTNRQLCFLELDPRLSLLRRGSAEFIGTLLLVAVIIGAQTNASQSAGERDPNGLVLAVAAGGVLMGLILALGAVSGGHFNPLITILQWMTHSRSGLCTLVYVTAQVGGGVIGAILASMAFGQMAATGALHNPENGWLTETLFSMGLLTIVFGCMRSALKEFGALAVGAWLMGSSVGLPNRFGNPALALGAKIP